MPNLGSRLKKAREKKRLTQQEVAEKLGVSNGAISGYERNYRDPDTEMLKRLANLYDVTVDYLTGNVIKEEQATYKTDEDKLYQKAKKAAEDIFDLPEQQRELLLNMIEAFKDKK